MLARVPQEYGSDTLVVGVFVRSIAPYTIETAFRVAREQVTGLPDGFRIHDLRHYFASLLIASGLDMKTVQARLRHASATTLDTYWHIWPDRDDATLRRCPRSSAPDRPSRHCAHRPDPSNRRSPPA